MKKLFSLLICLLLLFALVSCGDEPCSHTDANNDHVCDSCSTAIGNHIDAGKDHNCDYGCADKIGTCEDEDKDHDCDYGCDKIFGEHADGNDDNHLCDYGCEKSADEGCYDTVVDGKCDECGADIEHTCVDENKNHACDICSTSMGNHIDAGKDHNCDYGCADKIGTCEDEDKDHDCDYGCDKTFGTCEDEDKDHDCDYGCDKTFGTCEDEDKDHVCDYGCDKIGTCEDEDNDHVCDVCGEEFIEVINYPWESQTLLFELSENTGINQLSSGSRRYLAGEDTGANEFIDYEIAARNAATEYITKVDVTYTYLDDSNAYTWGKNVDRIETTVWMGVNPESPDVYVNFIYDLSYATLKGCFANLLGKTRGAGELKGLNYFEFAKEDYRPDKNQEGFFYDYMSNITTEKSKMFMLASDYTIDFIRASFIIPVNVRLAETVIEDVIGDVNKDTKFDIYDLYALVEAGKWTYQTLMDFAAEIYTPAADNQGAVQLSDEILGFAMTRDGFGESGLLYSTNISIIKQGVDSFGRDSYYLPETNEEFFELCDCIAALSKAPGVFPYFEGASSWRQYGNKTYDQIRTRFSTSNLLFGGVDLLGALENEQIQQMKETDGFGILPVPMYKEGVGYNVHIHNVGRVAAISAITLKFAECTAFLNYQSTHSADILSSYYDCKLIFDVAAGDNGTKSMLNLLSENVGSSFDGVTDELIRHYHGLTTAQLKELLNGQTDPRWHNLIAKKQWDADMRTNYNAFANIRRGALATFLHQYKILAD